MNTPILDVPQQMRALGQSMMAGSQGLTPVLGDFFAIKDGRITGCCAIGAAYIALNPEMRSTQELDSDFGQSQEDNDGIRLELTEKFPVLGDFKFSESFMDEVAIRGGDIGTNKAFLKECMLYSVISGVFDQGNTTLELIQESLDAVAAQRETTLSVAH
jgi:hypothetical protein